MRTGAAATLLVSGLLTLSACGAPQPPPNQTTTLQGNVFASGRAGGAPVQGARVTAQMGDDTETVITDPEGRFSLRLNTARTAQAFTLTVEPPARSNLYAATYDDVTLEAYRSPYGAANEFSIYLGTTRPSAPLPGAPARRGCVAGILKDLNGQPVVSNAQAVVQTGATTFVPRPLYPDCATEFSAIPNFAAGHFLLPQPGETGLVIYGGGRVVRTDAQGRYVMPVLTTQNLFGVSGSMWAGNYDGTDTVDPKKASAFFWSKFQYLPEVPVFTSGATDTRDIQLEAFDPATNPRVTTQPVRYDGSAVDRAGSDFFIETVPSFEHAITSGALTLGEYYGGEFSGQDDLRVIKLASDTRSQNISVSSTAYRSNDDKDGDYTGSTSFTGWRDGTNLGQALTANFIDIPNPQAPKADTEGASRTPTLNWKAVKNAKVYVVGVYRVLSDRTEPVWVGYTPNTSLQVPFELEAGAEYVWQVSTDDSTEMLDYIGSDPLGTEAARWMSAGRLNKAPNLGSALNTWRGEVALGILQAGGKLPQRLVGTDRAYQNLLETGYRYADSQEFTFTTVK